MSYHHQFVGETQGIRPRAPVRCRDFGGLLAAFWEAEGDAGGHGYYLSSNPRISIFFSDVSSIRVAHRELAPRAGGQPLAQVIYVPAGTPMWTRFTAPIRFSHLDLHFTSERLVSYLAPAIGRAAAQDALHRPHAVAEAQDLEVLAQLLVKELATPLRHPHFSDSLVGTLVAGALDLDGTGTRRPEGRLTKAQLRKLKARFEAGGGRRLTVAELADAVNLSESWFSSVFKSTTGLSPLQWQQEQRIALAQRLLGETSLSIAEIADRLGFTDQAHLTRAFRQLVGKTPAAWRREDAGEAPKTALLPPARPA